MNATELQSYPIATTTPQSNQGLLWDSVTNQWTPENISTALAAGNGIGIADNGNNQAVITNTGVLELLAGTGIGVNTPTGNVTVTNDGVTGLSAGAGISVSAATGNVTVTNSSPGYPLYALVSNVELGMGTFNVMAANSPPNGLYKMNVFFRVNNTVQVTLTAVTTNANGAQNYPMYGAVNGAPGFVTISALSLANPNSVVCVPIILQAYSAPYIVLQVFTSAANCVFVSGTIEQISSSI